MPEIPKTHDVILFVLTYKIVLMVSLFSTDTRFPDDIQYTKNSLTKDTSHPLQYCTAKKKRISENKF